MTLTLKSHASRGVFTTVSIFLATLLAAFLATLLTGQPALAQSETADDASLEEVYVVGSRRRDRSASDSPVPVDVISAEEFAAQGGSNLDSLISSVVPSYNVSQEPISDAATFIRPATLRGLAPDATLVLVNSKRRHRAAVIALLGSGISGGSQSPDVSAIPAIALDRLEVLRDGAAAQYGSDAIAGIMNFVLKENSSGIAVDAKWGEYKEGDGTALTLSANVGLPLTSSGFANLSFEWKEADPTDRAEQRPDAQRLINAGNTNVRNPAQIWGAPEYSDDYKFFGNFGIDLNSDTELYAFGNYAERQVEGGFFYRNPVTPGSQRSGLFEGPKVDANGAPLDDGMPSLRVADLHYRADNYDPASPPAGCPHVPIVNDAPDQSILDAVNRDDDCYTLYQKLPGGFTPQFGGDITDSSFALGVRGQVGNWYYDVSAVMGESEADFYIYNTVNPQLLHMGNDIPTSYDPGAYTETDTVFNIDVSSPIDVGGITVNFAAGLEWREEIFEITAGESNSTYIDCFVMHNSEEITCAQADAMSLTGTQYGLATQGFDVGSNGFAGFQTGDAGEYESESTAAYIDVESDVTSDLLLGGALRYEDYDEFGDTLNFKLTARYQVTDAFALRAAFSTGFRVPTSGQANLRNVTTEFNAGRLADIASLPPTQFNNVPLQYTYDSDGDGDVDTVRTVQPEALDPEESVNITLGAVFELGPADITIDYYDIEIEDRIALTSRFNIARDRNKDGIIDGTNGPDELMCDVTVGGTTTERCTTIDSLLSAGVSDASSFTSVRFFSNQQTVRARGLDVVLTVPFELGSGTSSVTTVANISNVQLSKFDPDFTGKNRRLQIENGRPNLRFNVTWTHLQDQWRFMGRSRFYGEYYDATTNDESVAYYPSPSLLFDAEVGYDATDQLSFVLGAENLFDIYPERNPNGAVAGLPYPESSPFGFNGAFYYLRARWSFDY